MWEFQDQCSPFRAIRGVSAFRVSLGVRTHVTLLIQGKTWRTYSCHDLNYAIFIPLFESSYVTEILFECLHLYTLFVYTDFKCNFNPYSIQLSLKFNFVKN